MQGGKQPAKLYTNVFQNAEILGKKISQAAYNTIQNHGFISSLKCDKIANKSIISP